MNRKILIADDKAYIRLLLEQTLEDLEYEGVEILSVEDGVDALDEIKAQRPNLVFLDVMMPRMNGFDVCRMVKRELGWDDVYVVILTARGQEIDQHRGREVGADAYITKPFDPAELRAKARSVLGLRE